MRRVCPIVAAALVLPVAAPAMARDYGQQGALFRIIEPDFLATIAARLGQLQASGEIDRLNAGLARRAEQKVNRPDPVAGIAAASRARSWTYDPSIEIDHDVTDAKGNLVARRGQRINPLDILPVRQALVFIDGDAPAQMDWALAQYTAIQAKIILVKGAPLQAMTRHQRRFYFDQGGHLTERFGIRAVPALAEQRGRVMQLRELVLPAAGAAR